MLLTYRSNNSHHTTFAAVLALMLLVLFSAPLTANDDELKLPELGDSAAGLMAPAQERALGQAWLRSFRASVPLESDPLLFEYVENLLLELASYSELEDKTLNLVMVKNPSINKRFYLYSSNSSAASATKSAGSPSSRIAP